MNSKFKKGNVYIEITKSDHLHGGVGWEFGQCLWSPNRNRAGHDRYSLMREPKVGDLVLHFYNKTWENGKTESRLCGSSLVSRPFEVINTEPPSPGKWADMAPYYRIELENFEPLPNPVPLSTITITYETAIRNELQENKPKFYPFCIRQDKVCTVEGIYLAYCTTNLYNLLKRIVAIQEGTITVQQDEHKNQCEYAEGVRKQGEIYFFSRNSQLAKKAKEYYGYSCCICGFNFEKAYGDIGKGYIECHHLNPLSEQNESEWTKQIKTTIDDVVVVCANCHRMIHSKRPSYSVAEIKESFLKNHK